MFRFHKHHIIIFQAEISQGFRLGFYHFIHSFHLPKSPACVIISHMYSLLLIIIYLAFISLGLPDSLIGSAWPVMRLDLSADLSSAGIITMIIACGTVVSSLLSDKLTRKLGAGLVTAVSTALTALALLGFSFATAFWQLCLIAVPYGLGAGAIDAALNNYVALNYSSRHMSWLHCFWGLGALISPAIMGACLSGSWGWRGGYRIICVVQTVLTVILFVSIPLWSKVAKSKAPAATDGEPTLPPLKFTQILRLKGVFLVMIAFFCYCAFEQTAMLWASSYLVEHRSISEDTAATFGSLFFIGITAGRAISGFVTERLGDRNLIRIGTGVIATGAILVALSVNAHWVALAGFVTLGLGCAPIYPSIIHATPSNFGAENSQSVIGFEMASAYVGTIAMPPLFGLIAQHVSIALLPLYIGLLTVIMFVCLEVLNAQIRKKAKTDLR